MRWGLNQINVFEMAAPKKAIILVAGPGTRLRPVTDNTPKCLIKLNDRPILVNALEILEKVGIEEVILVIGYLGEMIKEAIGQNVGKMKINYVENKIFDKTNNSYSLWLSVKDLDEPLLILEGDVFFEDNLLEEFMQDPREDLTIVEKYNPDLDGTFVDIDSNNLVLSWTHKKNRPKNFKIENKYKTVNIHKVSSKFLIRWLKPTLKKLVDETGGKEPIETMFKDIIEKGGKINTFHTKGMKWFEIDDIKDLKKAKEIFKHV